MEIDRFVLLIFYSAYSRSEDDARIKVRATNLHPESPRSVYARNTRRRGQSPLRINDSRINGHRRAIDAEFRICCAFGMWRIRSINGASLPRIKIEMEMERCNDFELLYFLLFSPRRKRGWTRKREGTFPATNPLRKIIILIAALTNDCLSTVDVNTPLLFYFVNA